MFKKWRGRKNETSGAGGGIASDSTQLEPRNYKIEEYLLRHPEFIEEYMRKNAIKCSPSPNLLSENRQQALNEFLLDILGSIFQDIISMDTVIQKVHHFAPRVVGADRASLFLVDHVAKEMFTRIYDDDDIKQLDVGLKKDSKLLGWKEIRFKIGKGIAGKVAETGETMNIADAYADPNFNMGVDKQTGYKTKNILCMPIFMRGTVIAVVQMVNKLEGTFTQEDINAFEQFALYCGLALHHAKMFEKMQRSQDKFKVALEVVAYHRNCTDEEFRATRAKGSMKNPPPDLVQFAFLTTHVETAQSIHLAVFMFVDLFGTTRSDTDTLYRFMITVRKNYRAIPYHNWMHAFTVAHTMYCLLKRNKQLFSLNEKLAMYVACLCHDLDHQGFNNDFLVSTASPLAAIYKYSVLEHHHFNQSVNILQQDDKNILLKLSAEDYKEVLGHMKHCIIATDLANFFPVRHKLGKLLSKREFTWSNLEHRLMAEALSMTSCDISASSKPWDTHAEITELIFEEFFCQGDIEKRNGLKPKPMMDRSTSEHIPTYEVQFLSTICLDCFELLSQLLQDTNVLTASCKSNLSKWKTIVELNKRRKSTSSEASNSDTKKTFLPQESDEKTKTKKSKK